MDKKEFAHLHCHTVHSVQDAMPTSKDYVRAIYEYNQRSTKYKCISTAMTDHGNIYGIVKHYNACLNPDKKERKIKPTFGCEVYHCVDRAAIPAGDKPDRFHLVLLATNDIGLQNLYNIVSDGGVHPFEGKSKNFPICDIEFMRSHGEGIIALTACIGGMVPQLILNGKTKDAEWWITELKSIFDEVYLEVQPHEIPEQLIVNDELVNLSKITNTPLVMTSDSHYIYDSDVKYHDILKKMSHQISFTTVAKLYEPEEMEAYCIKHQIPLECITNTAIIANKCNVDPKPKDHRNLLPEFPCPPGYTPDSFLRKKAIDGLIKRIIDNEITDVRKYFDNLFYELDVISGQKFSSYFLILWDWFEWCRNNGILTGPGRGSAAGSIISYALNITKLDPIKNGFVFERFLSPFREEFPDEFKVA